MISIVINRAPSIKDSIDSRLGEVMGNGEEILILIWTESSDAYLISCYYHCPCDFSCIVCTLCIPGWYYAAIGFSYWILIVFVYDDWITNVKFHRNGVGLRTMLSESMYVINSNNEFQIYISTYCWKITKYLLSTPLLICASCYSLRTFIGTS